MQLETPVYFRYTAANDTMLHQPLREVMDETLGIFHQELFHAKSVVHSGPKAGEPVRYSTRSVATAARVSDSPDFELEAVVPAAPARAEEPAARPNGPKEEPAVTTEAKPTKVHQAPIKKS